MKTILYLLGVILISMISPHFNYAQTQTGDGNKNGQRLLSDSVIRQRIVTDLIKRNPSIRNAVDWSSSDDGLYYGTYISGGREYMIFYDKSGSYIETLIKKPWNETAPEDLRITFDKSAYKSLHVTTYWEVVDPGIKGGYFELTDDHGRRSYVWVNEKGDFSTTPRAAKN